MKRTQVMAALLLLSLAACSSGGGASLTKTALGPSSVQIPSSAVTAVPIPRGFAGVTLTITVPQKKLAAASLRVTASRSMQNVSPGTQSVVAVITPSGGTAITSPGTCSLPTCTVVIPVPIGVASTVSVTLYGSGGTSDPIALARDSYVVGQFSEGIAQNAPLLTFKPMVYSIKIDTSGAALTIGVPSSYVSHIVMQDADGYDIGTATNPRNLDGVLDYSGAPITQIALSASNGATFGGPSTFNVAAGNVASDIPLALNYDGTAVPTVSIASLVPGGANIPVMTNGNYTGVTTLHGLVAGTTLLEYGNSAAAPAGENLVFHENIQSDAGGSLNYSPGAACAPFSAALLSPGSFAYSAGSGTLSFTYSAVPFASGACIIDVGDTFGNHASVEIDVNQLNINVQSKRHATVKARQ